MITGRIAYPLCLKGILVLNLTLGLFLDKSLGRNPAQVIYGLRGVFYITFIIFYLIPREECLDHERILAQDQGAVLVCNTPTATL